MGMLAAASFEACGAVDIERDPRGSAQIFENLVGRKKTELVRTLSNKPERYQTHKYQMRV